MASAGKKESDLRRLTERQKEDAWGKDYVAGIWATPEEAPKISLASTLLPEKLGGRLFHTLSPHETWAALLALYHPNVWDIHEQKVLSTAPRPHFLHGHSRALGQAFQPLKGTLDVSSRRGLLSRHPKCTVTIESKGKRTRVPYPYTGDLLLFLQDQDGPYVVNWSVKDKAEAFRQRGPRRGKPHIHQDHEATLIRHAIEDEYYRDAGIPTRQIVGRNIDLELRANLHELFLAHGVAVPFSPGEQELILEYFRDRVGTSTKAFTMIRDISEALGVDTTVIRNVLQQGIWRRQIRVDLFRPLLMDMPLRWESRDPIDVYRAWFSRG